MEKEAARPRAGAKSATAFRTISEVSDELDVPQHVLRFWETKFPQVRPLKRGGGRRYYRPEDVALLRKIQRLLYSEGYTIKGVQRLLKDQRQSGGDAEGAEALVDGLLGPGLPGDDVAAGDLAEAELAADDLSADDLGEAESPEEPPAAQPSSSAAAAPQPPMARPEPAAPAPAVSPPLPLLAPIPAAGVGGDLPVWLRRELTTLRTELADLKSVLRKAIR